MSRWPCVGKPAAGSNPIFVDYPQRTEAHVLRVMVVAEGENWPAVEPAELGAAALAGGPYRDHRDSPYRSAPISMRRGSGDNRADLRCGHCLVRASCRHDTRRGGVSGLGGGCRSSQDQQEPGERDPGDQPERVDIGQHIGFALHQRRQARRALAPSRSPSPVWRSSNGPASWVAAPSVAGRAAEDMQADQVRIGLLAHPHEGLDHRAADFGAEQPRDLDRRGDRRGLRRRDVGDGVGDERGDREGEPHRLDALRGQEIAARPIMGQAGIHPAAERDHREAEHQQEPGIDPPRRAARRAAPARIAAGRSSSARRRSAGRAAPGCASDNPAGRSPSRSTRSRRSRSAAPGPRHSGGPAPADGSAGTGARASWMKKATTSSAPPSSSPQTSPELSQSSRLPWSSPA